MERKHNEKNKGEMEEHKTNQNNNILHNYNYNYNYSLYIVAALLHKNHPLANCHIGAAVRSRHVGRQSAPSSKDAHRLSGLRTLPDWV